MVIYVKSKKKTQTSFNVDSNRRTAANSTGAGIVRRACNNAIRNYRSSNNSLLRVSFLLLFALFSLYYGIFLFRNNPFDQPFCDADGICHETPDIASPRTVYSAWNKEQYDGWWRYYETLNERVEVYARKRQSMYDQGDGNKSRPLVLLGDSITEAWSGTGMGVSKVRANGVQQVLEDELSATSGFDPVVLAIAGDQTQHLLYRLQHGHMRAAQLLSSSSSSSSSFDEGTTRFYDPSTIFVVMIGTNNLGSGELPEPTTRGILAVVEYLLKETAEAGCHVMLFQVLPRGDGKKTLPKLCPPRCASDDDNNKTPYTSFLPPIRNVNEAVQDGIQQLNDKYSTSRIQLVDCGSEFINDEYDDDRKDYDNDNGDDDDDDDDNNYEVKKKELMPDLLHPNAAGHRILAKCIRNYVDQIND